jgi:chemotaxis protein CheD
VGQVSFPNAASGGIRRTVGQGTRYVTNDPAIVLTTVLGSCVACCLYDGHMKTGGMNHFLLAEPGGGIAHGDTEAKRYGLYAMELLVNDMLKAGSIRPHLRAHLYGGANLHRGMQAIGTTNADFARRFLEADGIPIIHDHLGGTLARRIEFRAAMGQARCRVVEEDIAPVSRRLAVAAPTGEVELF